MRGEHPPPGRRARDEGRLCVLPDGVGIFSHGCAQANARTLLSVVVCSVKFPPPPDDVKPLFLPSSRQTGQARPCLVSRLIKPCAFSTPQVPLLFILPTRLAPLPYSAAAASSCVGIPSRARIQRPSSAISRPHPPTSKLLHTSPTPPTINHICTFSPSVALTRPDCSVA